MSTVVENQVVQMTFDNKEFERNIAASLKSLDRFKDEMEFDDEQRSFKELEKASEAINFDKLNKAADGVADHFSIVGRTIYKITDQIADYVTSKLTSAFNKVKAMTVDFYDLGGAYKKYDDYTHGVKSLMAALSDDERAKLEANGSAIDGVEEKLEELMWYTDETSYNFTDMVNTIGKFMGAGLSLDDAVKDMQGIANWAALSGQNATTASQAMYQLSQALGTGYLKYQDWQQAASLKNMGTTVAKDTFIEAAIKAGTISQEDINEAIKRSGGKQGSAAFRNWFFTADNLNDNQWLTTKTLEIGLQTISSASNEAYNMMKKLTDEEGEVVEYFDSASEIVRYTDQIKAGEMTIEEVIDDLGVIDPKHADSLTESFKRLSSAEGELGFKAFKAAQQAVTFQEAIDAAKDAVSTKMMKMMKYIIGNAEEAADLWTGFSEALWDVFAGPLDNINTGLAKWSKKTVTVMEEVNGEMQEVEISAREYLWRGFGGVLSGIKDVFGAVFEPLLGNSKMFEERLKNLGENGLISLSKSLERFTNLLEKVKNSRTIITIGFLLRSIAYVIRDVVKVIFSFTRAIKEALGFNDSLDESLSHIVAIFADFAYAVHVGADALLKSKGFKDAIGITTKALKLIFSTIQILCLALGTLGDSLLQAWGYFTTGEGLLESIDYMLSGLVYRIRTIALSIAEAFDIDPKIRLKMFGFFWELEDTVRHLGIDDKLKDIGKKVRSWLSNYTSNASKIFKRMINKMVEDIFFEIPSRIKKIIDGFTSDNLMNGFIALFELIGYSIRNAVGYIIDAASIVLGVDLTKFKDFVLGFLDDMTGVLSKLSPTLIEGWAVVKEIFMALADVFTVVGKAVTDLLAEIFNIEGAENAMDVFKNIIVILTDTLVFLINGLGKLIVSAGPYIKKTIESLKGLFETFWLAFKYLIHVDRSDEARKALDNVKSLAVQAVAVLAIIKAIKLFALVKNSLETLETLGDFLDGRVKLQTILFRGIVGFVNSIGIILLAIAILSRQDPGGLAMALVIFSVSLKIMTKAIGVMVDEIIKLYDHLKKNKVSESKFELAMNTVTNIMSKLSSIGIRLGIALAIITWVVNKYGIKKSVVGLVGMAGIIIALGGATALIVKASEKLKATDKQLKQVRKILAKVATLITTISVALYLILSRIEKINIEIQSSGGPTDVGKKLALIGGVMLEVVIVVGILSLISSKAKNPKKFTDVVNSAVKLTGMMALLTIALGAMAKIIDGEGPKDIATKMGIGALAIIAISVVMAGLTYILGKVFNTGSVATLSKATTIMAEMVSKLVLACGAIIFMISGVAIVVGAIGLFALLWNMIGDPSQMIFALGATALLFIGLAAMFKLVEKLDFKSEAGGVLASCAAVLTMVLAVGGVIGMIVLLASIDKLFSFGWEEVLSGLGKIAIILLLITALFFLIKYLPVDSKKAGQIALSLLELSGALLILTGVFMLFNLLDTKSVLSAALALILVIGVIAGLAALAAVIPGMDKALTTLANAVFKIAVAFAIFAGVVLLLTIIDTILDKITKSILNLVTKIGPLVEALTVFLIALLDALGTSLYEHSEEIAASFIKVVDAVLQIIFDLMVQLFGEEFGDKLMQAWEVVGNYFEKAITFIVDLFEWLAEAGMWVLDQLRALGENILMIANKIWQGIKMVFTSVVDGVATAVLLILSPIIELISVLKEIFTNIYNRITNIIESVRQKIKDFTSGKISFPRLILDALTGLVKNVIGFGKDIVEGLWKGISNATKWLKDQITGFCKNIGKTVKEFFGIHSPSKYFAEIGNYLTQGLSSGLNAGEGDVLNTVKKIGSDIVSNFLPNGISSALGMGDLASNLGNILNPGSLGIGELNLDISSDYAFDPSAMGLDSVYQMDIGGSFSGSGISVPTNFQPTVSDTQLSQISDASYDSSKDIVDAIHELKDKLDEQAEIIASYRMILDTGVLVGELTVPLDKALGNRTKLASGRGI